MNVAAALEQQLDSEFPSLLRRQSSFCALYDVGEDVIGRGRYAVVKPCKNRTNGLTYAGKFTKKRRRNEIVKELRVLKLSSLNPHIITLFEVHEFNSDIVFLLEYAKGGDLQTLLEDRNHISESECRQITVGLLKALSFLHGLGIVHLDVKPQNILLLNPWPDITVRLCDFGLAKGVDDGMPQEIAGTADYIAPEVISFDELTPACDIWSTGVVTYVLLSGVCPFRGDTDQEVFVSITRGEYDFPQEEFGHLSSLSREFISALLQRRPKFRPSAVKALQHSWVIETGAEDGRRPSKDNEGSPQ